MPASPTATSASVPRPFGSAQGRLFYSWKGRYAPHGLRSLEGVDNAVHFYDNSRAYRHRETGGVHVGDWLGNERTMPELPEIELLRQEVNARVVGKVVTEACLQRVGMEGEAFLAML